MTVSICFLFIVSLTIIYYYKLKRNQKKEEKETILDGNIAMINSYMNQTNHCWSALSYLHQQLMGKVDEEIRLPLTPMTEPNKAQLSAVMKEAGIL